MSITSRGMKWQIINSLWIIFTFTLGIFNWISFLFIGYKARCKKWIIYSIIYAAPFMACMVVGKATDFLSGLVILSGIVGIVHAFIIRQEYLIRLDAVDHGKTLSDSEVKDIIIKIKLSKIKLEDNDASEAVKENVDTRPSFKIEEDVKLEDKESTVETKQATNEGFKNEPIDINTASENELANLPSFGVILAKKAVNHRETKGYFNSVEEFAEALSLKPHVLERIKPLIIVKNLEHEHKDNDISNKNNRIIDF